MLLFRPWRRIGQVLDPANCGAGMLRLFCPGIVRKSGTHVIAGRDETSAS